MRQQGHLFLLSKKTTGPLTCIPKVTPALRLGGDYCTARNANLLSQSNQAVRSNRMSFLFFALRTLRRL